MNYHLWKLSEGRKRQLFLSWDLSELTLFGYRKRWGEGETEGERWRGERERKTEGGRQAEGRKEGERREAEGEGEMERERESQGSLAREAALDVWSYQAQLRTSGSAHLGGVYSFGQKQLSPISQLPERQWAAELYLVRQHSSRELEWDFLAAKVFFFFFKATAFYDCPHLINDSAAENDQFRDNEKFLSTAPQTSSKLLRFQFVLRCVPKDVWWDSNSVPRCMPLLVWFYIQQNEGLGP